MKTALFFLLAAGLSAQMRDNREKQMTCENNRDNGRSRFCKVSELTLPALGRLSIDAGHNGGVSVKGWAQNQTLVRSKVEAWAPTESEASLLAGQVQIETASGLLRATGPENLNENRGWAVSWEVFAPQVTDLKLTAHNGGVAVSDVRGRMELKTHNGGVNAVRVAGEIKGASHNGGIHVEVVSAETGQLDFDTYNGGIQLSLPRNFSARVHAETSNGSINSDFPMPESADRERRRRNADFNIGNGGPSINVKTHNGGVQLRKI